MELWPRTQCAEREQKRTSWSLWVFSKPTSGDLETGRSGRREEAGRVMAGRGSFPVYTGGINGKQQEKTECAHTSLRPQGLYLVHAHRPFPNTCSVLQISLLLSLSQMDNLFCAHTSFCTSLTQNIINPLHSLFTQMCVHL